ncbi:MAG TPA: VOC family protein [Thermoanaerobaculia bacterium]|nr:VOC family protein [Thermoanaerobaculia bacterium]
MAIAGGRPHNRRIVAHLMVRDTSRAIEFYQQAFGAEVLYQALLPGGKALHAHLRIADSVVLVSEEYRGRPGEASAEREAGGAAVLLELYVDDVEAAFERAKAAGAMEKSAIALDFYGDRYGQLADPFGHVWGLATVQETLTPEEIDHRMTEHFGLN